MSLPFGIWDKIRNEEIDIRYKAQLEHCEASNSPIFVPIDGFCEYCKKNIWNWIPLEIAKSKIITGCPNPICHKSYCD